MSTRPLHAANPYVGPRTFTRAESDRYYGREREARDLLSLVISQRLVLFYAQSGAGKSSLIHTRLIPQLEAEGFVPLPVGRVGGELPAGLQDVPNVYLFNLMLSLDQSEVEPARLAGLSLVQFLDGLTSDDGEHFYYADADLAVIDPDEIDDNVLDVAGRQRTTEYTESHNFVLILDQFEELVTTYPDRWQEREVFFQQLEEAMIRDPSLWVVLTLREDFVAALDPYAHLLTDKLRARYYMQRMEVAAALDALTKPAANAGRTFAKGVAEQLIDNLRQIRIHGDQATRLGQFVEPVQLQVVAFQLWEDLVGRPAGPITQADLREVGDVDRALAAFYQDALQGALAVRGTNLSERRLRAWFADELVTEAGTRGTVYQGPAETAGMSNSVVTELANRFLLRAEVRAGGTWIELVHDRFVDPILQANRRWLEAYDNPLADATRRWLESGRNPEQLATDLYLRQAEAYAQQHPEDVTPEEETFLADSLNQESARLAEARRRSRRRRLTLIVGTLLIVLFAALAYYGLSSADRARRAEATARSAQATAEANAALAQQELDDLEADRWLKEAYERARREDPFGAVEAVERAAQTDPNRDFDAERQDVRRFAAATVIGAAQRAAADGDSETAVTLFEQTLELEPPLDAPAYVWVPPGAFTMGAADDDFDAALEELDQHVVDLPGFWIMRTEVTNRQYRACVDEGACTPPINERWNRPQFNDQPVTDVDWQQASAYAAWAGGRLPTEAEWEKACRGVDARLFPWGNDEPTATRVNFYEAQLGSWTTVGSLPAGASPFGLLDMSGNVQEWTSSAFVDYPYDAADGREDPDPDALRTVRGGSFRESDMRCSARVWFPSDTRFDDIGFRIVSNAVQ